MPTHRCMKLLKENFLELFIRHFQVFACGLAMGAKRTGAWNAALFLVLKNTTANQGLMTRLRDGDIQDIIGAKKVVVLALAAQGYDTEFKSKQSFPTIWYFYTKGFYIFASVTHRYISVVKVHVPGCFHTFLVLDASDVCQPRRREPD
ncbi:uncharacterized protein NECHADRAFT_87548 [Fusarium vanettenii 77-13-4]|uniref:Uncharacterized protein n=1 Tax=Fusarium vanettenii (strain ATCC MYA-4622 / CBS 123669 / FGSC 9596 / NRRL 45880 / 77-13-4) TaxID=660122 RepID=C7ZE94_FUSV7|nr:uncharacterized protein NECHADRAFT_87548 [Fusarium vanettenii 77-13-4]EEU37622.1 predicted protein [Fusarium vanettenii 77-13-4]